MKRLALILTLALSAFIPSLLGQTVQAPGGINFGGGVVVKESAGNGAPPDTCVGLARYTQNDAIAGLNLWQCVAGHMVNEGNSTTISNGLSNALPKTGGTLTGALFLPSLQGIGMISSSNWGSGTNNLAGFFNNASNCNGSGKPCFAIADPGYASTETYSLNQLATSNTSMGAAQAMLMDMRNGYLTLISHNPALRTGSTNGDRNSIAIGCTNDATQNWTGGTGQISTSTYCLNVNMYQRAPGVNLGNATFGPTGWSNNGGLQFQAVVNTPGISQTSTLLSYKVGTGDNVGQYIYQFGYGGATAPSDEGSTALSMHASEANFTFAGTIATGGGGTGATHVVVTCTNDCNSNAGNGRYLIRTQAAVATGQIAAFTSASGNFTPGTATTTSTVPVSTFWGTLNANVVTPQAAPLGTGSTAMTFAVTKLGGASAPQVGDLLCFGGSYHEQALVSAVTGSGPYTITASLRHQHEASSWVMANGACGTFLEMTANTQSPNGQALRFPVDVLGSTSANTLVYRYFAFGSGAVQSLAVSNHGAVDGVIYSVTSLTNINGTVTFNFSGGVPAQLYNATTVYFSNASDTAFNGACTNVKQASAGFLCTQAASAGHSGPATASLAIGTTQYGNTTFNLWAGAEVLDILDYTSSPPSVNGHLTLEPNNVAWANGDAVEQPHHYAGKFAMQFDNMYLYNPFAVGANGVNFGYQGAGISGGSQLNTSAFAGLKLTNYNSTSMYAGNGGYLLTPNAITFTGPWGTHFVDQYAPAPNNSTWAAIPCPWTGCSDVAYFYSTFQLTGRTTTGQFTFRPFQGSLTYNGFTGIHFNTNMDAMTFADNISFAVVTPPSNASSFATTGGQLTDATTYFYKVVPLNGAGTALQSTEFSVTTGSNSGNNRIRVQWSRVPGATGWTICRGTSSGTELSLTTLNGGFQGDNTFFDDFGTLTPSGTCPGTTDTSRGGIEQASHIGLNSSGTGFEVSLKAPAGLSASYTEVLPPAQTATTGNCFNSFDPSTGTYGFTPCSGGGTASSLPHVTDGSSATQVAITLPVQIDDGTGNSGNAAATFGPAPTPSSTTATLHANSTTHRWQQNPAATGETVIPGVPTTGISAGHAILMGANGFDFVDGGAPSPNLGSGTPSLVADSSAGTSPTLTLVSGGTDRAGWVSLVVGTSPNSSAGLITVQFGGSYSTVPKCDVSPANAAAAALSGTSQPYVAQATSTTAQFVIFQGSTALTAGTTYIWRYSCSL